jgi:hypothetical protein
MEVIFSDSFMESIREVEGTYDYFIQDGGWRHTFKQGV